LILFFLYAEALGQVWPKVYGDDIHAYGQEIMEYYDNGYLICGSILKDGSTFKYGWLIKTDINGIILWDKKFGDGIHENYFLDFDKTIDNGLIISGGTSQEDVNIDPLFIKINSAKGIVSLPGNEFLGMIKYYDPQNFRISIVKFDSTGEPLWIKHLAQEDSTIYNEEGYYLNLTTDSNYIISGGCFCGGEKPFWIKTDTTGEQIWDLRWPMGSGGWANQSVFNSFGMIYLLKFNENGEAINQYPLMGDTIEAGGTKSLLMFNDTILYTGITWTDDPYMYTGYSDILKTDTLGNLILQRRLIDDNYPPTDLIKTHDDKILAIGHFFVDGNWDIYMWKMNSDLEDDTLYTQPLIYDSLCTYQIISDTLDLNCSLFVNIDDIPTKEEYESTIRISPNPARDWITLNLPEGKMNGDEEVIFYNSYGQMVKKLNGSNMNRIITVNISDFPPGIYISVLRNEKHIFAKGKFVVTN
jgi:hypothetical protein